MKLDRDWHRTRRGIAGIVATVFMFAMLFTVGASYFLFVNQNNMLYSQAASARASVSSAQQNEDLVVTASKNSSNYLGFTVQNLGGTTSTVTAFMVTNSNGTVLQFCEASSARPCPSLPFSVNQGATSALVSTNVTYSAPGTYTVKAITQLGNDFSATYPPTATSLASQALSSGAIGDLYLTFHTFTYYKVVGCGSTSGYCLSSSGSGFIIPAGAGSIAFAVSMTNLNPEEDSIVLDQFTLIYQNSFYGNNHQNFVAWYVVSNSSNDIQKTYTPIVLPYDTPVTVVFASTQCVSSAEGPNDCSGSYFAPGSSPSAAYTISANFIISHGWELPPPVSVPSLTYSASNYGQDAPFVSTLYT